MDRNYKILFFHGRGSTATTSTTGIKVKEFFEENDIPVFIPDYNPDGQLFYGVEKTIHDFIKNNDLDYSDLVVMGVSLGGYWALKTANELTSCTCVLLNPALHVYGKDQVMLPREHNRKNLSIYCYLNKDDEIIDNEYIFNQLNKKATITQYETGGHRMTNLSEIMNDILVKLRTQFPVI